MGDLSDMVGDAVEAPTCPRRERILIVRIERGRSVELYDTANFTDIRSARHSNGWIRNRIDSHADSKQRNPRSTVQLPINVVVPVEIRIGGVRNQA